jgi:hypothetical protein
MIVGCRNQVENPRLDKVFCLGNSRLYKASWPQIVRIARSYVFKLENMLFLLSGDF